MSENSAGACGVGWIPGSIPMSESSAQSSVLIFVYTCIVLPLVPFIEPNPNWSVFYASGGEILNYFKTAVAKWNLARDVKLGKYRTKNRFRFVGNGRTWREYSPDLDLAFYLTK